MRRLTGSMALVCALKAGRRVQAGRFDVAEATVEGLAIMVQRGLAVAGARRGALYFLSASRKEPFVHVIAHRAYLRFDLRCRVLADRCSTYESIHPRVRTHLAKVRERRDGLWLLYQRLVSKQPDAGVLIKSLIKEQLIAIVPEQRRG